MDSYLTPYVRRPLALLIALAAGIAAPTRSARGERAAAGVAWEAWEPAAFERARRERRLIVVTVSAAWCHWCHVMQRKTWSDPRVASRVAAGFVPIRVDADARPDLAERFTEYRWPATVFLTKDAKPLAALRGYRGPEDLLLVLDRVEAAAREGKTLGDVSPPGGSTVARGDAPSAALRDRLERLVEAEWDEVVAGWGSPQKYPYPAAIAHGLLEARLSSGASADAWRTRVLRTLAGTERLIDPVWGGLWQYSEGGVWTKPHYEKIAAVNAGGISAFASAYRLTGDERWLRAAKATRRWLLERMRTPEGTFKTSQDADLRRTDGTHVDGAEFFRLDDAGRRRLGEPRIDAAVYAQENGWIVQALCELDRAGDPDALAQAAKAAEAIHGSHRDSRGAFRHAAGDAGPLHLGDTVAMGHASLALDQAGAVGPWRERATKAAEDLVRLFLDAKRGGFFETTEDPTAAGTFRDRIRPFEGNAAAARFLIALHEATGTSLWRTEALRAIEAVSDPGLAERFGARAALLLLAVEEATFPWTLVTLGGASGERSPMRRAARALEPLVVLTHGDDVRGPPRARVRVGSEKSDYVLDADSLAALAALLRAKAAAR